MASKTAGSAWDDIEWAAALTALLGFQIHGVWLRAAPGPVRDYWLDRVSCLSGQSRPRKIPANIPESRLLGGINLTATLRSGQPVPETGLIEECDGQIVLVAMAERLPRNIVHHICVALDEHGLNLARDGIARKFKSRITAIAIDEGTEDETIHPALKDRLGIAISLDDFGIHDVGDELFDQKCIAQGISRLESIHFSKTDLETLVSLGVSLDISSPRITLNAIKIAKGSAALEGRDFVGKADISRALRLSLLPHAKQLPEILGSPPELDPEQQPEPEEPDNLTPNHKDTPPAQEHLLEATFASLPDGLLQQLQTNLARARHTSAGKSGTQQRQKNRGRPTGSFRGDCLHGGQINILATLRAAAPWQKIRRGPELRTDRAVQIRRSDIHLTRFLQKRETLTIFVIDASGSAALQRMSEAKGAVELLLADCYVRRDQVAVIAFRENSAELLLPPTKSLVRAKRTLAALPGGGATPVAAALQLTFNLVGRTTKEGKDAQYILLTDGAANIARDGTRGRESGTKDALTVAKTLSMSSVTGLIIDTAQRPQQRAKELANVLGASYIALPKADSRALNRAIRTVTS